MYRLNPFFLIFLKPRVTASIKIIQIFQYFLIMNKLPNLRGRSEKIDSARVLSTQLNLL